MTFGVAALLSVLNKLGALDGLSADLKLEFGR
jgi:hypothetical protein